MPSTATATTDGRPATSDLVTIELELTPDATSAFLRVVSTLARRGCEIRELHSDPTADGRAIAVSLVPPPRHAHCVSSWLGNLVDVTSVRIVAR